LVCHENRDFLKVSRFIKACEKLAPFLFNPLRTAKTSVQEHNISNSSLRVAADAWPALVFVTPLHRTPFPISVPQ